MNVPAPGGGFSAGGLTRLFSTFSGTGDPSGRIVFDFDPNASVESIGIRCLLPDGTVAIHTEGFSVDEDHHIGAVYEEGELSLYLDGELVASAFGAGGPIDLGPFPLRIGEDLGGIVNENFIGVMDDVVVLGRALSPAEMSDLANEGSAILGGSPPGVGPFVRGDPNSDGAVNITDPIGVLNFLFLGGESPACSAAADSDADGATNITDAIFPSELLVPRRAGSGLAVSRLRAERFAGGRESRLRDPLRGL